MVMFIDRKEEMAKLEEIYESPKAELVLVYGRRRVGKSRLLVEFAKKTGALYMLADLSKSILDILSRQTGEDFVKFKEWDDFFEYIYKSKHKVIIIDEFQYLYQVDKAWPSMLQRWWEKIKETDKKIILSGSMVSTIYKISKGYGSALYGRKTYEIQMNSLKFKYIRGFLPDYNFEELVQAYAVLGGIPRYLEEFDPKSSIKDNIRKKIIDKTSFLYNEPINLLFEEFRDPAQYIAILTSIVQGRMKFAEIADMSRIDSHKLPKYITVLERCGIVEKELPVTEKKTRTKTTRYKVADNFYKFWFEFIFCNKSTIEQGLENEVSDAIWKEFNTYVGRCFEKICMEFLVDLKPMPFVKIGNWWHKDIEIDIVGLNNGIKQILFAECKWQDNVDAKQIFAELKEKSQYVQWNNEKRTESYAIFAKSFKEKIRMPNLMLFDSEDIYAAIE